MHWHAVYSRGWQLGCCSTDAGYLPFWVRRQAPYRMQRCWPCCRMRRPSRRTRPDPAQGSKGPSPSGNCGVRSFSWQNSPSFMVLLSDAGLAPLPCLYCKPNLLLPLPKNRIPFFDFRLLAPDFRPQPLRFRPLFHFSDIRDVKKTGKPHTGLPVLLYLWARSQSSSWRCLFARISSIPASCRPDKKRGSASSGSR